MAGQNLVIRNTHKWLEENRSSFTPPVCNKCMFSDQLKVFYVGGPNQRSDYHIEEGEEFFYQEAGDMCLKVIEGGEFKDIVIKEGEVFMLPAKIYHSPQRFSNTIGLVVERTRNTKEFDALTYFVENSNDILFEKWMHLEDVVKDLPPVIRAFFASEAHRTGRPTEESVLADKDRPYAADMSRSLERPFSLQQWLQDRRSQLRQSSRLSLFQQNYATKVEILAHGSHEIAAESNGEIFLKMICGSCSVGLEDGSKDAELKDGYVALARHSVHITVHQNSYCLSLRMPTPAV